jgi:DNA-directed RNA polymerase specialized sigma24 family protein
MVEGLPEDERAVFDLLWYHGLTEAETATALGESIPAIKRHWLRARLHLQERLARGIPS